MAKRGPKTAAGRAAVRLNVVHRPDRTDAAPPGAGLRLDLNRVGRQGSDHYRSSHLGGSSPTGFRPFTRRCLLGA